MAIITSNNTNSKVDSKGKKMLEDKVIDLSDASLKSGKKSKLDPTEDAWARTAPPPKGDYNLKLFLAKDGFKANYTDPEDLDTIYYIADLECKIQSNDKEVDGFTVFSKVTTRISRGKNISTLAGLIVKCGYKLPEEATPLELIKMLRKVLATEPILRDCHCDWNAWSKNDQKNIYTSMEDFPEDEEGNKRHQFSISNKDGGREDISASFKIKEWGSKKGKQGGTTSNASNGSSEGPKQVKRTEVDTGSTETVEVVEEAPKPRARKSQAATPPPPPVEEVVQQQEEEEELLLSDD